MQTFDPHWTAAQVEDATHRLPIGTRVRSGSSPNLGTVRWQPFVCDAGTVSVLVAWDNLHPDRNTHLVFTRNLVTV